MKGVAGVYSEQEASRKGLYLLYGVQHRGQEGAGLSAASDNSLRTWSGSGLVSNVFDKRFESWIHPDDYLAIGSASGENRMNDFFPPLEVETDNYKFALTLDGHLHKHPGRGEEVLSQALKEKLETMDIQEAMCGVMKEQNLSYYSLVMAFHDKDTQNSTLIAARDGRGIRPLYAASNNEELFIASESASIEVLENIGLELINKWDIPPGTLLMKDGEGWMEVRVLEPKPAHCAFEWVYYSRPDSVIEGKNVHTVRKRLGHALVRTHNLNHRYGTEGGRPEGFTIIPVPDSGRSVCTGVSEGLGIPSDEGVIKNAYMGRTYIIDDPKFRKIASDLKHNIVQEVIQDKKVVITDDSIVRGTVSESIAKNLLRSGAREVEFLVSYAPIFYPCFSDPKDKPLTAAPYKGRELMEIGDLIAEELPSINKVLYNSPENIIQAIGLERENICSYCITKKNPFK
jgi:amidophosphoribosyltransferase